MSAKNEYSQKLLSRFISGEDAVFKEIFNLFSHELIHTAFKKTGDWNLAEDLVQNIFVSLWQNKDTLSIQDLTGYLYGALKYAILKSIREEKNQRKYLAHVIIKPASYTQDPSVTLELSELSDNIEKAIKQLPAKSQEVFRLSRLEHKTTKEIASCLNISEKTVEYHITQSLKLMRTHLKYSPLMAVFLLL